MLTRRIAAVVTTIVLGVSGVALAQSGASGEAETATLVSLATSTTDDSTSTSMTSSTSGSSVTSVTTGSSVTSATVAGSSTSTTGNSTTSPTIDDDSTTSTTIDDRGTRTTVALGLATYTVGEAGTVTVNGMTLVAVQANPGWTVEVDEVSSDKIKVEFERGETDAEFELRADGELRIRTHD